MGGSKPARVATCTYLDLEVNLMWPCTIRHMQLRAKETSLDRKERHSGRLRQDVGWCEYIRSSEIEPRQVNKQSSHDTHNLTHANAHPSFTCKRAPKLHLEHLASRPGSETWPAALALVGHVVASHFKAARTADSVHVWTYRRT